MAMAINVTAKYTRSFLWLPLLPCYFVFKQGFIIWKTHLKFILGLSQYSFLQLKDQSCALALRKAYCNITILATILSISNPSDTHSSYDMNSPWFLSILAGKAATKHGKQGTRFSCFQSETLPWSLGQPGLNQLRAQTILASKKYS